MEDLVNKLREAVGNPEYIVVPESGHQEKSLSEPPENQPPVWFSQDKVTCHLDAREMLNRGEHPVGQVLADLQVMEKDNIYELVAPFYPAPLIEKAAGIGYSYYLTEVNHQEYRIYFFRP